MFRLTKRREKVIYEMPPAQAQLALTNLMLNFEALGIGCEFGMVQRVCGAEPLSLLRFSGSAIVNLTHLLENSFDGFLSLDDLQVSELDLEYMVSSRRYQDFLAHTAVYAADESKATMLARQAKKFDYLKERFQRDWENAARIYVHSGCDDEDAIRRLHAALRRRSDCTLLWVVHAGDGKSPGSIEHLEDGLYKGFLRYLGRFDLGPQLDIASWVAICEQVQAAVQGTRAVATAPGSDVQASFRWKPSVIAACETAAARGRCLLYFPTSYRMAVAEATLTGVFAAKSFVTVSLWIRLPTSFDAKLFEIAIDDVAVLCQRRADLSLRETWQQLWIVVKLPRACNSLKLSMRVEKATQRSTFHFAHWRVQHGSIADRRGRPTDDEIFVGTAPHAASSAGRLLWVAKLLRRAVAYIEREDEREASGQLSSRDTLAKTLLQSGDTLMHAKLFDKADAILSVARDLYPWDAEIESHYALSASWAGHHEEAVRRWTKLTETYPQLSNAHYSLAASFLALGEIDRAIAVIEPAVARFSNDACMLAEAARVYGAAGFWNEAVVQWDRALAINAGRAEWRRSRDIAAAASRNVLPQPVPLA